MKKYFEKNKKEIKNYLDKFLRKKELNLASVNRWGNDLPQRFKKFAGKGKAVRGNMVILSYEMYGGKREKEIVKIATALELFHSSFLIHDDIIDEDKIRRGNKTIFAQYEDLGKKENSQNPYHFGESLGICAGDIGFFWGFEILSDLDLDKKIKDKLIKLYAKELVYVGLGEMQDIYLGSIDRGVEKNDVFNVHLYKTARYTFSLPLMVGALTAGKDKKVLERLAKIGELIGLIFQIKDDELGLFGDRKVIGKPVGSDIKEGKKTLYHYYLMQEANKKEKEKLSDIFGSDIGEKEVNYVRGLVKKHKIDKKVEKEIDNFLKEARDLIESLKVDTKHKKVLENLLNYNLKRKY